MNPILPIQHFVPDVEARQWSDGRMYLYGSYDISGRTSYCSWEYHVFSSADLIHWEHHGESLRSTGPGSDVPWTGAPLFAPDCIYYDGRYYLCSSDWEKRGRFGTVFERSIDEAMADKVRYQRGPDAICRTCNHDPVNRVIHALRESREDHDGELGYEPAITVALLARHTATLERFVADGVDGDRPGTGSVPASLPDPTLGPAAAPPPTAPVPIPAPRRRPGLLAGR